MDEPVPEPGTGYGAEEQAPAESIAYVVFTSGSTGQPKAVGIPYRQLINRFNWMWEDYPFAADAVGCFKTSPAFVDS